MPDECLSLSKYSIIPQTADGLGLEQKYAADALGPDCVLSYLLGIGRSLAKRSCKGPDN